MNADPQLRERLDRAVGRVPIDTDRRLEEIHRSSHRRQRTRRIATLAVALLLGLASIGIAWQLLRLGTSTTRPGTDVGPSSRRDNPSASPGHTAPGPGSIGYNPCPSLPCSLLDTYKVTYRLSDGSLVGMDSYKFDPGDPSAGPNPGDGEAVLDISGDAALIAELAKDIDAYHVNLSTGQIERKPGYVPPSPGPSP